MKRPSDARKRRGVASLELVMSFPVLVVLVAMLFTIGIATKKRSQVTMDVRHQAWAARTAPSNTMPFSILRAHSAGRAEKIGEDEVTMYRNLFPYIDRDIKWGNILLTGTWDKRQVVFGPRSIPMMPYPHLGILLDMATAQGGVETSTGSVGQLNRLRDFPLY